MLCALCLSMFSSGRHAGLHHACIEDLAKAARGGCKICLALLLRRFRLSPDPENEGTAVPFLRYKWAPDGNFFHGKGAKGSRPRFWEIQFDSEVRWLNWGELPWNAIYIHISYKSEAVPDWYARLSGYAASDLDSEPWRVRREIFPLRPIPDSTGHESVLEIGKMWMESCERFHDCEISNGPVDSEWYPRRLIYIPEATSPRLLETNSERPHSRYATLSHCWGSNPSFITLTTANLDNFRQGIPVDILASSFRDAMLICDRLSIRYIWIDSLCILQDSESDWLWHTEEMSLIYQNCYLNLSFDAAASPEESAFRQRNPDIVQECCAFSVIPGGRVTRGGSDREFPGTPSDDALSNDSWESRSSDGENSNDGSVEASSRESESANAGESLRCTVFAAEFDYTSSTWNLPLSRRGWVVQERLLSPRVLHFTNNRIMWECDESRSLQEGLPLGILGTGEAFETHSRRPFNCFPGGKPHWSQSEHFGQWARIVREYSGCLLTYPEKDKLVAIAAVAQRFAAVFGEEYYAGHFRQNMPFDLAWEVLGRNSDKTSVTRRSPTWSWTSVDAEVFVPSGLGFNHSLIDVKSVSMALVDESHRYGPSKEGRLRIECSIARCVLGKYRDECSDLRADIRTVYVLEIVGNNDYQLETELTISLDGPENGIEGDMYFIPVIERKPSRSSKRAVMGLILLKQTDGSYKRVGSWDTDVDDVYDLESGPLFEWVDKYSDSRQLVVVV